MSVPVFGSLGDTLVRNGDVQVDSESIKGSGKVIGLYFSAHWCPPCRTFTPQLAEWYNEIKETSNGSNFEIVFVSSDREEGSFKEYFAEMPWLALPYAKRDEKDKLSKLYKVNGIPTLILIDGETGSVLTTEGRSTVKDDPKGEDFPWKPKKFSEVIAGELVKKSKEKSQWEDVKEDVIGLYFSAHWCGPCRAFTPQLIKTYNKVREDNKSFQIIFASSDRDEESMQEYLDEMPWLAIPFGDKRKKTLSNIFAVSGIPILVLLKRDGEVITNNGRAAIGNDPEGKEYPWTPKPVNPLTGSTAGEINETPCIIFFTDNTEEAKEILKPIAVKYVESLKTGAVSEKICFFYHNDEEEDDDIGTSLKTFANLKKDVPLLVLIDVPSEEIHVHEGNVDAEAVNKIVKDYDEKKLTMRPLRS